MQLVIDIPDEYYDRIFSLKHIWEAKPKNIALSAIANGVPLDKINEADKNNKDDMSED